MKYRKKPVVIEATQWLKLGDHPNVTRSWSEGSDHRCPKCGQSWGEHGEITTLESKPDGAHHVCPGDWIITGVKGEHYACKTDIFAATYDPSPESPAKEQPGEQNAAPQVAGAAMPSYSQTGEGDIAGPIAGAADTIVGVTGKECDLTHSAVAAPDVPPPPERP